MPAEKGQHSNGKNKAESSSPNALLEHLIADFVICLVIIVVYLVVILSMVLHFGMPCCSTTSFLCT
jgi:hypothetical protein